MNIRKYERVNQVRDITGIPIIEMPDIPIRNLCVPVVDINPKFSTVVDFQSATATGVFYSSLRGDMNWYITSVSMSYIKDAACDIATGFIAIDIYDSLTGMYKSILSLPVRTLTLESGAIALSFPYPLKLKLGQQLRMTGTFTAGALNRYMTISAVAI